MAEEEEERAESTYLIGVLTDVSSRKWGGGWGIGTIEHLGADGKKRIRTKITGPLAGFVAGDHIEAIGAFVEHPNYGPQYEAVDIVRVLPSKVDAIKDWLVENIPNIGPERAKAVVDRFGTGFFKIFDDTDCIEKLVDIDGITPERAVLIYETCIERKERFLVHELLVKMGLTAKEIRKTFTESLNYETIKTDPLVLYYRDVIPYTRMLQILEESFPEIYDSPKADMMVVHHVLKERNDGSTAIPLPAALEELREAFIQPPTRKVIEELIAAVPGRVEIYGDHLLPVALATAENTIAAFVRTRTGKDDDEDDDLDPDD